MSDVHEIKDKLDALLEPTKDLVKEENGRFTVTLVYSIVDNETGEGVSRMGTNAEGPVDHYQASVGIAQCVEQLLAEGRRVN